MTDSEIQYYVKKRREGWDNSLVRKELESMGYTKKEVFYWMNRIDDEFVSRLGSAENWLFSQKNKVVLFKFLGFIMIFVGLLLSVIWLSWDNLGGIKIIGVLLVGGYSSIINSRRIKRQLTTKSISIKRGAKPTSILDLFTRRF